MQVRTEISEPPVGIEPTTFSRDKTQGSTRLHRSPLNCGNALKERHYDGLEAVATATELHRTPPPCSRRVADWRCLATGTRQQHLSARLAIRDGVTVRKAFFDPQDRVPVQADAFQST